jgi:hypothetical protein
MSRTPTIQRDVLEGLGLLRARPRFVNPVRCPVVESSGDCPYPSIGARLITPVGASAEFVMPPSSETFRDDEISKCASVRRSANHIPESRRLPRKDRPLDAVASPLRKSYSLGQFMIEKQQRRRERLEPVWKNFQLVIFLGIPRCFAPAFRGGNGKSKMNDGSWRPFISSRSRMLGGGPLPERFGHWNSVWKRFDRLSKAGVFEDFFDGSPQ